MNGYTHIACRRETKKMLQVECKEEFLRQNPDFRGINITDEFILRRIVRFYLEA